MYNQANMLNYKYKSNRAPSTHQSSWTNLLVCVVAFLVTSAHGQVAIHDDHYYVMSNRPVRWEAAAVACRADGGYLVSINTQEEQTFAYAFHTQNAEVRVWIGLKCELETSCDGAHWEDGTALTYTAWWRERK